MIDLSYLRVMANYNRWFNGRLYACCAELDEAELRSDRGAFFKSVFSTLEHIVHADESFMAAFSKRPMPGEADLVHGSFADLRAARAGLDDRIVAWAAAVVPAWLDEPVTFASQVDGAPRTVTRAAFVMHMFNHQTHHRGQVTTLLSQRGLDVGLTDLHGSF